MMRSASSMVAWCLVVTGGGGGGGVELLRLLLDEEASAGVTDRLSVTVLSRFQLARPAVV